MATIQTDLKLENHMKDFATSLKHTHHNQVPTLTSTATAARTTATNMKTLQNGTSQTDLAAAAAAATTTATTF